MGTSDTSGMNGYAESGSLVPSNIELSSLVSSIQDLLPGLGEGFIQQCLQYYGYSTEAVINALLEDSLPPSLVTLDRSLPAIKMSTPEIPPAAMDKEEKPAQQADFMDRANIYDHDEFDVFSRKNVDHTKIHKGKKINAFVELEADAQDKKMLRDIARQYEERGGTSIYEDEFRLDEDAHRGWEYDDEYDDTYDDHDTGNMDVMPEFVRKRPGIVGAGRLNTHIDMTPSKDNSSEEGNSEAEEKSRDVLKKDENRKSTFSQSGARPKNMGSKQGVQRIVNKSSTKFSKAKQTTPTPEREETEEKPKDNFQFCENPEDVRHRADQRRQEQDAYRFKGYRGGRAYQGQENGHTDDHYGPIQRTSTTSNRSSGKSWRQGTSGDDDNRRYHGGKYKEDTNHGKAQSQNYRHKMMHKNEHKRQGAQAKFNRNN